MAPSTRLRVDPERRVLYSAPAGQAGSRVNPIELEDTPPTEQVPAAKRRTARKSIGKQPSKTVPRARAGAVVKPKEPLKKTKAAEKAKREAPAAKRDCIICASTKNVAASFRLDGHEKACEHFESTCGPCVQKMVSISIAKRHLAEAELACPVSGCAHVLDYAALKIAFTNKALFADYDKALAKHHLAASPHFIACLSTTCGRYFSTESCTSAKSRTTKQKVSCPYCDYDLCLTCNRPWHPRTGCNKAKEAEDQASVARIKTIGAKPCPKCGVNIEKTGGCDHMTCHRCRHDFCWQCLVPYKASVAHLDGCPHGRRDVAVDPENWAPADATVDQVNALIEQARRRLDEPDRMVGGVAGQQMLVLGPQAPVLVAPVAAADAWGQVGAGALALFNFIGGGNGGG